MSKNTHTPPKEKEKSFDKTHATKLKEFTKKYDDEVNNFSDDLENVPTKEIPQSNFAPPMFKQNFIMPLAN